MRSSTLHPLGFALSLAFWAAGCGGDDGGPNVACTLTTAYAIGATVNGELTASDCDFGDGTFIDQYRLEAAGQVSARFSLSSGTFDAFLWIFATGHPGGQALALHDDIDFDAGNTNSSIHILMAPDSYVVGANSAVVGARETGAYTLTSAFIPSDNTGCGVVWVTPGTETTQTLEPGDCQAAGPIYSDEFTVVVLSGQSLTATMTSAVVGPRLVLFDDEGTQVATDLGGSDATTVFTGPADDFPIYVLVATTDNTSEIGDYTLTIQVGN